MTLNQLIKTASNGYPDNLIERIHAGGDGGDGLASFVATKIKETFDEDASDEGQLDRAMGVVDKAILDLIGVMRELVAARFH